MKKGLRVFLIIGVVLSLLLAAAALTYVLVEKRIIHLSTVFVSHNDLSGVDLSHYQGETDMQALKEQGISFVYVKATEGATHTDECFLENWENAKAAGLYRGAYHFFSFQSLGVEQAKHFIETAGDLTGALIPAVDVEPYGGYLEAGPDKDALVRELSIYLDALEEAYGVKPMIYAPRGFYEKYLRRDFSDYPLWEPLWVQDTEQAVNPFLRHDFTIWQYSDKGVLQGYAGEEPYIDLNVLNYYVNIEDLIVP